MFALFRRDLVSSKSSTFKSSYSQKHMCVYTSQKSSSEINVSRWLGLKNDKLDVQKLDYSAADVTNL